MTHTCKIRDFQTAYLKGGGSWLSMKSGRTRYHLITGVDSKLVGLFIETPKHGLQYIETEDVDIRTAPTPKRPTRRAMAAFAAAPVTLEWTTAPLT